MYRWIAVLALLCLLHPIAQAGTTPPSPPTLHRQLAAAADTARIRVLRKLADHYFYSNFDSAWQYARQAHALARLIRSKEGLHYSHGQLGILYGMRGNTEASVQLGPAPTAADQQHGTTLTCEYRGDEQVAARIDNWFTACWEAAGGATVSVPPYYMYEGDSSLLNLQTQGWQQGLQG